MIAARNIAMLITTVIAIPASAASSTTPDFSGIWARNSFNFEAPPSGPGPITNMRRVGEDASRFILGGDPVPLVGDYTNPILKPQAADAVKRWGDVSAGGHDNRDPSNQCADFSPPFMLQMQQRVEIVQREKEILFLYQGDDHFRHVRLNETHPKNVVPSPMGHSVAHYDGDALVVDTVGIKLMPYTVADRFGTPQSEAMHVIERYRLIDADEARTAQERHERTSGRTGGVDGNWPFDARDRQGLQIEVTVEDPNVFTTKWTGHLTYRRTRLPWEERVCAENNTDVLHQGFEHVPTAAKPDF